MMALSLLTRVQSAIFTSVVSHGLRMVCTQRGGTKMADSQELIVLGIEASFDDTAVAIVNRNGDLLHNTVESQIHYHKDTGGTVPSTAAKIHRERLPYLTSNALKNVDLTLDQLSAVAFTQGPGLALCLQETLGFVQNLWLSNKSFKILPVHHMEAHLLTARLCATAEERRLEFPFLVLLASGGHCLLILARGLGDYVRLGTTLDDSPGEAFDKTARMLGIDGGGPGLESVAKDGDPNSCDFKVPLSHKRDCNFSFSGLKTAARRAYESGGVSETNIAASFQKTVCQHLLTRTHRGIEFCRKHLATPVSTLVVSGGVASNLYLRERLGLLCELLGCSLECPPGILCRDNGAMIAWTGLEYLMQPQDSTPVARDPSRLKFHPSWPLGENRAQDVSDAHMRIRPWVQDW